MGFTYDTLHKVAIESLLREFIDNHYIVNVTCLEGHEYVDSERISVHYVILEAQHNSDIISVFNDIRFIIQSYTHIHASPFFINMYLDSHSWRVRHYDNDHIKIFNELVAKVEDHIQDQLPEGMYKAYERD